MRLTEAEQQAICRILSPHRQQGLKELRLFGSRLHDSARGGDIDLLLVANDGNAQRRLTMLKAELLVDLKASLGDQKIDLIVCSPDQVRDDPFLRDALAESRKLPLDA